MKKSKNISLAKYFIGLSRDSLIYGLGNAVLRILALLTAPIFTRVFVPAEYGVISLVASVISFLSLLLIFGMDNALFVSFYQYKRERKTVISSAFWFLFVWGFLMVLVANIFASQITQLIFKDITFRILFMIAFWTAYGTLLINLAKIIFRLEFRAKTFAFMAAFQAILSTGLMILLVVYFKRGLPGYFEGSLFGTAVTVILALYLIKTNLHFKISFKYLKEMLAFGFFVLPASLAFFVFDLSDRFFINYYRDLSELGLYSIGINVASLLVFFSYALGQAWSPQVMKIYFKSKKIYHQFVPRFFSYYLIFFFILAVTLSLFSLEILKIFTTEKFYPASQVIPPLAMAMVFSASNQVTSLGITLKRQTKYFALYTILAAILNIILNFILIPQYGMMGAALATALSYLFLTFAYYINSQKFVPLKIDWQKILKLLLLSLAAIILAPLIWQFSFLINLLIKFSQLAGFLILLYLFGVIEKQEIGYLRNYIRRIVKTRSQS